MEQFLKACNFITISLFWFYKVFIYNRFVGRLCNGFVSNVSPFDRYGSCSDCTFTLVVACISPNVVTSPGTVLNGNSVKTKFYKTPSPYFIVLASSVTTMEAKAIEFHRIVHTGICVWLVHKHGKGVRKIGYCKCICKV